MFQVRAALGAVVTILLAGLGQGVALAEENAALAAALESISAAELRTHVEVLADDTFEGREAGSRGGRAAGNYLAKVLDKLGLKPAGDGGGYFQAFGSSRNVLALLEGSDDKLKNEVIVVSAHYDHVGYGRASNSYGPTGYIHNGADDNASGTAAVLETAEAATRLPSPPRRSILFALWDGEEGGLLGSKHWVAQPTLGKRRATIMLNLDMVGRLRKDRLEVYGIRTARGLRELVSRHNMGPNLDLDFNWDMKADSDHYSFFERGIPTLMLHTGLHENYHRPSDDAEKVNYEGAQSVTRLLFPLTIDLADRPQGTPFRAASRSESSGHRDQLEAPVANPPPRFGVTWAKLDSDKPGLVIASLTPDSAAIKAGLRVGDRLLEFAGKPLADDKTFAGDVLAAPTDVEVVVERAGSNEPLTLAVKLAGTPARVGIGWREDEGEPGSLILTQVLPGSPAQRAGMNVRDRIYEVAGEGFSGGTDLRERLSKLGGPVEMLVERHGRMRRLTVELPPVAVEDK